MLHGAAFADPPPARALFVGNSYLYYEGGLARHLTGFAAADGLTPTVESATISNGFLDQHDLEEYLTPGWRGHAGDFDLVLLQEHSSSSQTAVNRRRFRTAVQAAAAKVREAGARLALYMTQAYASPHPAESPSHTAELRALYVAVGAETGAQVVPVGLAFREAYRRRPDAALQDALDGSHPTLQGAYLAAATVYAALFGRSPVGNAYDAEGALPLETTRFLQTVARDTVRAFFRRDAG